MTPQPDIFTIMLKALWVGLKWPLLLFFLFMIARMLIAPVWYGIKRMFDR